MKNLFFLSLISILVVSCTPQIKIQGLGNYNIDKTTDTKKNNYKVLEKKPEIFDFLDIDLTTEFACKDCKIYELYKDTIIDSLKFNNIYLVFYEDTLHKIIAVTDNGKKLYNYLNNKYHYMWGWSTSFYKHENEPIRRKYFQINTDYLYGCLELSNYIFVPVTEKFYNCTGILYLKSKHF